MNPKENFKGKHIIRP